jgi:hypothetical protein
MSLKQPLRIAERMILVEGWDCKVFVETLIAHMGLAGGVSVIDIDAVPGEEAPPSVHDFGGIKQLRIELQALVNRPEFPQIRRIAIVRDAETAQGSAWQSVRQAIASTKLTPPSGPELFGTGDPAVGVFFLPGGQAPGMLESLCWRTVPEQTARCVETFLDCVGVEPGDDHKRNKPRMAAWLATRPAKSYLNLSRALTGRHIPLDHDAFGDVRSFLARL